MTVFEVQGIDIQAPQAEAFALIADPEQLPKWTEAFASLAEGRAVMRTPGGEVRVDLEVSASAGRGTIDWRMKFADGSVATAFSRVVPIDSGRCVHTFIRTPPPLPRAAGRRAGGSVPDAFGGAPEVETPARAPPRGSRGPRGGGTILEASVPTVALSMIPASTRAVGVPRLAAIGYPMGRTFGRPGDADR